MQGGFCGLHHLLLHAIIFSAVSQKAVGGNLPLHWPKQIAASPSLPALSYPPLRTISTPPGGLAAMHGSRNRSCEPCCTHRSNRSNRGENEGRRGTVVQSALLKSVAKGTLCMYSGNGQGRQELGDFCIIITRQPTGNQSVIGSQLPGMSWSTFF